MIYSVYSSNCATKNGKCSMLQLTDSSWYIITIFDARKTNEKHSQIRFLRFFVSSTDVYVYNTTSNNFINLVKHKLQICEVKIASNNSTKIKFNINIASNIQTVNQNIMTKFKLKCPHSFYEWCVHNICYLLNFTTEWKYKLLSVVYCGGGSNIFSIFSY